MIISHTHNFIFLKPLKVGGTSVQQTIGTACGDGTDTEDVFANTRGEGFGAEVKRRILLGTYVLSRGSYERWYGHAQRVRARIRSQFDEVLAGVDLIAGPTSPVPAFPLGERTDDPLAMYRADAFTVPASLAGLPALSVPAGLTTGPPRLPLGLQLIGAAGDDGRLLDVAQALEDTGLVGALQAPLESGDSA